MARSQFFAEDGQHPTRQPFRDVLTCMSRLAREDSGEDLVEYGLLTAFIGLAGVAVFGLIMAELNFGYTNWDSGTQGLWEMPSPS